MTSEASISIRPYQVDDASALCEAAVESVREVRPFMLWCRPDLTVEEARRWIKAQVSAFEFVILSADRRFLGGCGVNQIDYVNRRANLGYWVRSSATRQGVATTAIRQLVHWAFTNTDLVRLEVVVSTQNVASLRAAQKSGAAREGILKKRPLLHGAAHDAVMLSLVRGGESPG